MVRYGLDVELAAVERFSGPGVSDVSQLLIQHPQGEMRAPFPRGRSYFNILFLGN